ncbi:MAG: hypothetical protein E7070_09790 [Bacteroidales bacterium]|jgi:hypothetical protein|nr:hypothetical protein [Bacteroidales bacterium]
MKAPLLLTMLAILPDIVLAGVNYNDHHLLLDQNLSNADAEASPYLFNQVQEALAAINRSQATPSDTITLDIAPGVYWVDDPDDPAIRRVSSNSEGTPYGFRLKCPNLRIVGQSDNPEDVVLACNRGQTQGAIGNFTMFYIDAHNIEASNVTFGNYCSVDLVYPRDPRLNRPRRANAIVQAQLIHTNANFVKASNCRFISRLNLCPFSGVRRALFSDCHFECTDDALEGAAIYQRCHFEFFSSKPFWGTPDFGAVFIDCKIDTHVRGTQYFCKTRGGINLIRTQIRQLDGEEIRVVPCYGTNDAPCYYSEVTLNGHPLKIEGATDITELPLLEAFTVDNLLHGPLPTHMRLSPVGQRTLNEDEDTRPLQIQFFCWNGQPAKRRIGSDAIISATMPSGLTAATRLHLTPQLDAAPGFARKPSLKIDRKKGIVHLDYQLNVDGNDMSHVTWYRFSMTDKSDTVAVRHGLTADASCYAISPADAGYRLMACVTPKLDITHTGTRVAVQTEAPIGRNIAAAKGEESSLTTDFHDVPIRFQPKLQAGCWTFDAFKPADTQTYNWLPQPHNAWFYGHGVDGAAGSIGLNEATKGARAFYTPARKSCKLMTAKLLIAPAKTAGQGFGSATGQYLDIGVKFDAKTLTGYALRIRRTPDYDRAVVMQLVRYQDGIVSPIGDEKVYSSYLTSCEITVMSDGKELSATASHNGDILTLSAPIQSSAADDSHCTFYMQHTGSTGASASLIERVELEWK